MPTRALPQRPCLVQYRKQAKDLLKSAAAGEADAIQRIAAYSPTATSATGQSRFTLAQAQFSIARDHGFPSWPKFTAHLQSLDPDAARLKVWRAAESAVISADEAELCRLLQSHSEMFRTEAAPTSNGLAPNYSAGNAEAILLAAHEFETREQLDEYLLAMANTGSRMALFEDAADAIVSGDLRVLHMLLDQHPWLVSARSTRRHHATLLHYSGANGIEYWRQRSPKNAVAIANALLEAGSDVNSIADMYGGSTTIGLVATSVHPDRAHVQAPLMQLLAEYGAKVEEVGAVNGCLANGRRAAAEWFADHGAPLDLEGAAGVGRLELVKSFFDPDGTLKPGVASEAMNRGFAWACEYGRTVVVRFLLDIGMDLSIPLRNHNNTGLHWAAHCAHIATAKLLISRGADINAKDGSFNATPLSWALHGWGDPPPATPASRYYSMVRLLIASGAEVDPAWLEGAKVNADPKMSETLRAGLR